MKEGEDNTPKRGAHFDWLKKNLPLFLKNLGAKTDDIDILIADYGHNCYSFHPAWQHFGVPFEHGVAVYLLSNLKPWSKEVRVTKKGWIHPSEWVAANYQRFKEQLPQVQPEQKRKNKS